MTIPDAPFLTTGQVAAILQVNRQTVRNWCDSKRIQGAIRLPGNGPRSEWRIPRGSVPGLGDTKPVIPEPDFSNLEGAALALAKCDYLQKLNREMRKSGRARRAPA